MQQWSVRFETTGHFTEDHAETVLEALEKCEPAVSYSPRSLSARFWVEAETPQRAVDAGFRLFRSALSGIGIKPAENVVEIECQRLEDLDRSIEESNAPDVVGVAEVAKALRVSKQRTSELARSADFPRPVAHLASGPVWKWSAIARYVKDWTRRPGRPTRVVTAAVAKKK